LEFKTKVGVSYPDKINVHGNDLAEDLIGEIPLVDMTFLYTNKVNMLKKEGV
jgi:citrate synthase